MVPQNNSSFLRVLWSFLGLYASPSGLSYWWNSGSTLGLFMVVQMLSGWLLTLVYVPHPAQAFSSVDYINREVSGGAVLHIIHLAGASLFFAILFIHVARGLMAGSFVTPGLWFSGVGLLGVAMLTAFLGYTLPWGQMSFWGATVITSLVSTLPIVGWKLVIWLWGGFSVGSSALLLFYTAHYTVPMVMACLVVVHLMLLHQGGSHTQLSGLGSGGFIPFTPYFVWKDSTSLAVMAFLYGVSLCNPWVFADVENWLEADPLTSPVHIQPEWYFLFAYAILRAVPSKLGGVLALLASVLILAVMPFIVPQTPKSDQVVLFFGGCLMVTWGLLTWLGGCPVESPFLVISQIMSVLYFVELIIISMF